MVNILDLNFPQQWVINEAPDVPQRVFLGKWNNLDPELQLGPSRDGSSGLEELYARPPLLYCLAGHPGSLSISGASTSTKSTPAALNVSQSDSETGHSLLKRFLQTLLSRTLSSCEVSPSMVLFCDIHDFNGGIECATTLIIDETTRLAGKIVRKACSNVISSPKKCRTLRTPSADMKPPVKNTFWYVSSRRV